MPVAAGWTVTTYDTYAENMHGRNISSRTYLGISCAAILRWYWLLVWLLLLLLLLRDYRLVSHATMHLSVANAKLCACACALTLASESRPAPQLVAPSIRDHYIHFSSPENARLREATPSGIPPNYNSFVYFSLVCVCATQ